MNEVLSFNFPLEISFILQVEDKKTGQTTYFPTDIFYIPEGEESNANFLINRMIANDDDSVSRFVILDNYLHQREHIKIPNITGYYTVIKEDELIRGYAKW